MRLSISGHRVKMEINVIVVIVCATVVEVMIKDVVVTNIPSSRIIDIADMIEAKP